MQTYRVRILELDGNKNPSGRSYDIEGRNLFNDATKLPIVTRIDRTRHSMALDLCDVIGFGSNLSIEDGALQCDIKFIDALWPYFGSVDMNYNAVMFVTGSVVTNIIGIVVSPATEFVDPTASQLDSPE